VYVDDVVVHHHPSTERDAASRAAQQCRNELWCAWLRLPRGHALAATWRAWRIARTDPVSRRAWRSALAGLPWALRHRRGLPDDVVGEIALVQRAVDGRASATVQAVPPRSLVSSQNG
jgi:hypothetical protein